MDKIFVIRIIISFVVAGLWIAAATLLSERLGSKTGGLFTNLPSTVLISLLFISLENDASYVVEAVQMIPIGMAINTLFLFSFIILLRYGLLMSSVISLLIWFVFATTGIVLESNDLFANLVFYILIVLIAFVILEKVIQIKSIKKLSQKYKTRQILIRASIAGTIVSSVIVISKFCNPTIVGILATFPAVLLSTMILLGVYQTKEFAQATGKVLILSSSNIVIYGLAIYLTYPVLGIVFGTIISFTISFFWVWLLYPIVQKLT